MNVSGLQNQFQNPVFLQKSLSADSPFQKINDGRQSDEESFNILKKEDEISSDNTKLTGEEEKTIEKLKKTDQNVRRHEQAHMAAGSGLTSGATFTYTTGPDGKRYATGGEVSIDTSTENTPEKTIQKAQKIKRAALAPADPSAQDRAVAAQAERMEIKARMEQSQQAPQDKESTASENAKMKIAAKAYNTQNSDQINPSENHVSLVA